jgi:membrane protein required for colicin V production
MTALDIILLLLVGGMGLIGLQRGFVAEALSIVAWILAVVAVRGMHARFTDILSDKVGTPSGAAVLAFAIIFGVTFLVGRLVARQLGDFAKNSAVGFLDRLLGFGFGALKGLIGATLVYTMGLLVYDTVYGGDTDRPTWVENARSYQFMNACSSAMTKFVAERRRPASAATQR